jgi:hypothetical protein
VERRRTIVRNPREGGTTRAYYGFSSFLCVPGARSQPGGYAMGAQAGPAAMERVVHEAGFTRFRAVAETPLNLVYEIRR